MRSTGMSTLRLTRRGRLVLTVLLTAVLLTVSFAGWGMTREGAHATSQDGRHAVMWVTVRPGDTLWSIASSHGAGGDVRDDVVRIRQMNALDDSGLRVGQRIVVPSAP